MKEHRMKIRIDMNELDFERITEMSTDWSGYSAKHWVKKRNRFETEAGENLSFEWNTAYWVGCSGTAVILAKSYLASQGYECQIVWDLGLHENGEAFGWIVLTNYKTGI
jgi:hypothetical protein